MIADSPYMTMNEAASFLRVSLRTVYTLTERGELPAVKVGGQWRVSRGALEDWLDASRRQKAAPHG